MCAVVGLLAGPGAARSAEAGPDRLSAGIDHYFNREFDAAVTSFRRALDREPESPRAHFHYGKALLYQELHRLGMVGTSAFRDDEAYNDFEKPKPDPLTNARIREALDRGRTLCEGLLKASPEDRLALHSLARILAVRAAFELMVAKAYFKALASGRRARAVSYRVAELYPEFVDGQLVAGLDEYILGSLPWALRALIAVSGYRGNRRKGREMIARVAREGGVSRDEARVLLAVLLRRERRHAEAADGFRSLAKDFPRAYTFALEAAAMDMAAGNRTAALAGFREAERKRAAGTDRYSRMPERLSEALARRIEKLQQELELD